MRQKSYAFLSLLLLNVAASYLSAQDLPLPSGRFGIGYHRFEWTDPSRQEILDPTNRLRELVAEIWYPAEKSGDNTVSYLDTSAIFHALGSNGLSSLLGMHGATLVRSNSVHTHAYEDAPFDHRLKAAPVIFFSHGMGMMTQLYTTQVEDLVSHGYIVVTLLHPYDAWLVSFNDGRFIPFERKQRNDAGNTEEQHIAYENIRVNWWAADIRFALDELFEINKAKPAHLPFSGRMDLTRVGALGHSIGGRAAARACQLDTRIRSCADQDGVAMMQPFYPDASGAGMKQPFLLFERDRRSTLIEKDAASLGMTLQELTTLVKSLRNKKQTALASTGGSFHVLLHFDSSSHMSFSDLPLLQAKTQADAAVATLVLQVTSRYTREFFDKTLRGITAQLYTGKERLPHIDLVEFFPKKR